MSRISLLVVLLVIAVVQFVWVFRIWRRDGVAAALRLMLYGVLSAVGVAMQYELGL